MIISKTPFRISFVGGGTDLRSFYSQEDGKVLSTTIDKYIYVAVKRQIGIVEHKFRIAWCKVEYKDRIDDIEHPIVREALKVMEIDFPVEITTFADVPGYTGLGSSSAFTVGLLHALFALKGQMINKGQLASMAAHIEMNLLGGPMGSQDHYAAAYGNINVFTFKNDETVIVSPVFYRKDVIRTLEENLMLFYTGFKRDACEVLKKQEEKMLEKFEVLKKMKGLVDVLLPIMSSGVDLNQFGKILHEGWLLKRSITSEISSTAIDQLYQNALNAGALGGKLLGAGGGGFLLFYVEPQNQASVLNALSSLYHMRFKVDTGGSRITYYDQTLF